MTTPNTPPTESAGEVTQREYRMVTLRRDDEGKASVWCDPEIADLVDALNTKKLTTIASCSGHGHRPGSIVLRDGRYLMVFQDMEHAQAAERSYPTDINGKLRDTPVLHQEHEGESGWTDWIHPEPGYLMGCCDCGLIHEMQFMVGRAEPGGKLNPGETEEAAVIYRARRIAAERATPADAEIERLKAALDVSDRARERDLALLERHCALSDALAAELPADAREAWYHLTSMFSHRGDGLPTQFTYPKEVRDAALSLVLAVLRQHDNAVDEAVEREVLFKAIAYVHANGGGAALPSADDLMDPVHQSDLDRLHAYVADIAAAIRQSKGGE